MSKAANPRNRAGKKHRFNKPWMKEHLNDHWVQEAQRLGYRARPEQLGLAMPVYGGLVFIHYALARLTESRNAPIEGSARRV